MLESLLPLMRFCVLGDLVKHFGHEPFSLELTMDIKVFLNLDNSKDRLTLETFALIFVVWVIGVLVSLLALVAELTVFKRNNSAKEKNLN